MIQIRIHSLDAMRAADHHGATGIVSGLEHIVVFQQGNHLACDMPKASSSVPVATYRRKSSLP